MNQPNRDKSSQGKISPDLLAGISVRVEAEEDLTVQPCQPPQTPVEPTANGAKRPGPDQLAGVYVEIEAPEDLSVHLPEA